MMPTVGMQGVHLVPDARGHQDRTEHMPPSLSRSTYCSQESPEGRWAQ
jgi:hypothetical protein